MWIAGGLFTSTPTLLYTIGDTNKSNHYRISLFKNRPLKDSMDNSTPYMRENNRIVKELIEGTYFENIRKKT